MRPPAEIGPAFSLFFPRVLGGVDPENLLPEKLLNGLLDLNLIGYTSLREDWLSQSGEYYESGSLVHSCQSLRKFSQRFVGHDDLLKCE